MNAVVLNQNGQQLAVGTNEGIITCWSVKEQRELWRTDWQRELTAGLTVSPDGRTIVSRVTTDKRGIHEGSFAIRSFRTGRILAGVSYGSQSWDAFAFSKDGTLLAAGNRKGKIAIWQLKCSTDR